MSYFPFTLLLVMGVPFLITTFILAIHAQWRWRQTVDKILRGMNVKDVQMRVEKTVKHRQWARYHAFAVSFAIISWVIITALFPPTRNNFTHNLFDDLSIYATLWVYGLFIPHMLALLLYHIRWNPKTLQRKQKLDAKDAVYKGDYDLDPDARYGVNDEGELIQLAMDDEMQKMQQS